MTSMTEIHADVSLALFLGVDTHLDTHHAALIDSHGRKVSDHEFGTDAAGCTELLAWAARYGVITTAGVEGTGGYGAGLTRHLHQAGVTVVEVDHPDRRARRRYGKSDPLDAYAAAAVQSGRATTIPKDRDGDVESIRLLHNARASAVKARAEAMTQLKSVIVTCPDSLRTQLRALTKAKLIRTCAALRPDPITTGGVLAANKTTLRRTAKRILDLSAEIKEHDRDLRMLTRRAAPDLLALVGVGFETASQLLVTVGENRDRIHAETSLARLCGVAPLSASSGKTKRHRLNRGGDRQGNRALHTIVLCRLKHDPRTKAYVERRAAENKSDKEIMRCLKRYVAREIYRVLNPKNGVDES
ncbi:IS110 family transposase [Antrihabitans sp. YC3-6]|uniref:IS110 family transposase n=1 Tax=Antrihabitans stalagmiti TaxID=2799499 RepID=A0A934U284_9NOCA|nr:IS110 family transposase [Antrihabitans stalagmiti]MBJ8339029.1 IS110 family transposase [Antrihabitans stalagmiti]